MSGKVKIDRAHFEETRHKMDDLLTQAAVLIDKREVRTLVILVVELDGTVRPSAVSAVSRHEVLGALSDATAEFAEDRNG